MLQVLHSSVGLHCARVRSKYYGVFYIYVSSTQGIAILPTSLAVEIGLSIIYFLWLVLVIAFYVFYPSGTEEGAGQERRLKKTIEPVSFEMNSRNGSLKLGSSRKSSCTSESSRGPQPLTKNIISEEKMIQLRKKSMDFMEAQRQMKQLNAELGLKHQLARELEEDEGFKVRMEKKDSNKSDPDSDLDDSSRAPLHSQQSSPELEDPFPSLDRNQLKRPSSSDEEEEEYRVLRQTHSSSSVNRASTFNYGSKANTDGVPVNIDSDTSERGGSLRITRHSKRARGKMEHIFKKPDSLGIKEGEESPTFPSLNITPCTPPLNHHPMVFPDQVPPQLEESTDSFTPLTAPVSHSPRPSPRASPMASRRKRRAGVVPPPIGISSAQSPTPGGDQLQCPFHSSMASRSSPKPCRRNASPVGSSAGEDGASPKPVRKKKVSVAQIEATIVPSTPVNPGPPKHMAHSPSFNSIRTHEDAFADNAFRSVMQISQDAICCANSVGDIVFWSVGACKMFGYTPGEAIGSSLEVCVCAVLLNPWRGGGEDFR